MTTFKQFIKINTKHSSILSDAVIAAHLALRSSDESHKVLYAYAYRLAGAVGTYMRAKRDETMDDTDWQDAVQDCAMQYPQLLASFKRKTPTDTDDAALREAFDAYLCRAFQRIIWHSIWGNIRGGTGGPRSKAYPIESLEGPEDTEFNADPDYIEAESTAFGTRDPMVEAIAEQEATNAVTHRLNNPKKGRTWEW